MQPPEAENAASVAPSIPAAIDAFVVAADQRSRGEVLTAACPRPQVTAVNLPLLKEPRMRKQR